MSARSEFLYIQSTSAGAGSPKQTPKLLESLFPYYWVATADDARGHSGFSQNPQQPLMCEPLIVDDNILMWPAMQHDNILVVRETRGAKVWNVQLFPVLHSVLSYIHSEFFRQLEVWDKDRAAAQPPSTVRLYKEFLRSELTRRIAEPAPPFPLPMPPPPSSASQPQPMLIDSGKAGGQPALVPPLSATSASANSSSPRTTVGPSSSASNGLGESGNDAAATSAAADTAVDSQRPAAAPAPQQLLRPGPFDAILANPILVAAGAGPPAVRGAATEATTPMT
ncbi:hypothetical protein HK405_014335 [Cladochytrium tenue]|nr:hypothetical protein HK405_014335 [Cladochytrium tenue]